MAKRFIKKNKIPLIWISLILLAALLSTVTYAWLAGNRSIDCELVEGSIITQYFHCGTGTEDDPFVITRPVHFYNLVNLYQRLDGFANEPYFFQLGYQLKDGDDGFYFYSYDDNGKIIRDSYTEELNMAYYSPDQAGALLPIGTSEKPFVATFEGNNLTVKNLYITPTQTIGTGTENEKTFVTCDVGIFGYVDEDAKLENAYFSNVTIDLTGSDADADCTNKTVHNVSDHDAVYVGYIAGHIVTSATVENFYVNDVTIQGGNEAYCNFGYFGCVEDPETGEQVQQLGDEIARLRTKGDDAGFGGSIDMYKMYSRLLALKPEAKKTLKYPSEERIVIDEVTGEVTSSVTRQGDNNYYAYYHEPNGGGDYFYSLHNDSTAYMYVAGLSSELKKTVITCTLKNEYYDAYLLEYNGRYLTVDDDGTLTTKVLESNATPWVLDGSGHLFTYYEYQPVYLNVTSSGVVTLSDAEDTQWTKTSHGELTCEIAGTVYYLIEDGDWKVVPATGYRIDDGNGHYLGVNTDGSALRSITADSDFLWQLGNPGGTSTDIGAFGKYLTVNNGALALGNTPATWHRDGNGYYTTVGSTDYFLTYDGGEWKVIPRRFYTIHDGNGHYFRVTGNNAFTSSDEANASHFYFSNDSGTSSSGTVSTQVNGTTYYLRNNNGTLQTTTTAGNATSWQNDGSSIFVDSADGNTHYALRYNNNTWNLQTVTEGSVITDGNGNYLRVTSTTAFSNTTNASEASLFTQDAQGHLTTTSGTTTVYLRNNNGTLALYTGNTASSRTTWTSDGENFRAGDYALVCKNGTWQMDYAEGYLFSDGTHYMAANGTNVSSTTDPSKALVFSATSGTISMVTTSGVRYLYNSNSGNTLSYSTSSRTWTQNNGQLYGYNTRYLYYNGSTWTVQRNSGTTMVYTPVDHPLTQSVLQEVETTLPTAVIRENVNDPPRINTAQVTHDDFDLTFTDSQLQKIVSSRQTNVDSGYPSYFPLRISSDDEGGSGYAVSPKNTGYIIGGSHETGSGRYSDIRISQYAIRNNISNSYSTNSNAFTTLYTSNDSSGSVSTTPAQFRSQYVGYEEAEKQILETLNGQSNVYGLHFMNSQISTDNVIKAEQATILGKTYTDYELPEDAIDFNVVERGAITFFAGTYFSGNNAFFSLHQIFRDSDQKITDIKEIAEVYEHKTLGFAKPYIYKFTDGTYSNADGTYSGARSLDGDYTTTPVFKTAWITAPKGGVTNSVVYYFEIPCNAGEYALGSVEGKTGAYLIYLDIATNGGDAIQSVLSTEGNAITNSFDVDFRSSPETSPYSLMQFSIDVPVGSSTDDFSVLTHYDESSKNYTITVENYSDHDVTLFVYLCDNDDDQYNDYPYSYSVFYKNLNGSGYIPNGAVSNEWKAVAGFRIHPNGAPEEVVYVVNS